MPDAKTIGKTAAAVSSRNVRVIHAGTGSEALATIRDLLPESADVMNGYSTTLLEVGYDRLLAENPKNWRNCHAAITAEDDTEKRHALRRRSVTADYFLSGVQAIAESGKLVGCDKSGSRVGAWPHGAGRLIFVSGVNKIVPTLDAALARCREHALPLENQQTLRAYGVPSAIGKMMILEEERIDGRTTLITDRRGY
ncbi:lactate utilization protein [Methanoculleus sp. FWC-SCC1]|uniref:Lactate utilization protein n=2 Tax=Methanoculleus frigidifontis TaxID=2584085 RepID=A0ABT8ME82_9EURY|nr:lactate utilization protein [Methanoculleus sp. FWC-SCC1]